jgi:hypothetical protein
MRIESNRPVLPVVARRDGKSGSAGGTEFASSVSEEQPVAASGAARPMGSVDGLFALQELPDALAERKRAVARGNRLLDYLDRLRLGLLEGNLPRTQIADLVQLVHSQRGLTDDPRLGEILDEIDLRARVELAKLAAAS